MHKNFYCIDFLKVYLLTNSLLLFTVILLKADLINIKYSKFIKSISLLKTHYFNKYKFIILN
jgi:hypothetical protein